MSANLTRAQYLKPGEQILYAGRWRHVSRVRPLETTVRVFMEDGSETAFTMDDEVQVRRNGVVQESSQNHIEPPKIGRFALKDSFLRWRRLGLSCLLLALWVAGILDEVEVIALSLSVKTMLFGALGLLLLIFLHEADEAEAKRKALEDEISSFPADEFLHGMTEGGVEAVIGGTSFSDTAKIRLRFPEGVLLKHLTDAMVSGWQAAQRERDLPIDKDQERGVRQLCEKKAASWIQEMTQGRR